MHVVSETVKLFCFKYSEKELWMWLALVEIKCIDLESQCYIVFFCVICIL